jgi:chromate transporter
MVSYWEIFKCFSKIGAFTLGGGYAMIPIIQREVVENKKWIGLQDFMDVLAIAQSAPGVMAVNISIFLGYKLRGNKGSVVATLGSCLPSFITILLIAMFFAGFRDNPIVVKIFKGIRPVVVALIAVPVVDMVKQSNLNVYRALLAIATAVAIVFLKVSPIYIILVVGVFFFMGRYFDDKKKRKQSGNNLINREANNAEANNAEASSADGKSEEGGEK